MRPNLDVLRSALLPMLTETGTIRRQTGNMIQDEETGMEEPEYVTVYTGPVLVRPQDDSLRMNTVGGVTFPVLKFEATFPAETPVVIGDILTLTICPFDDDLIGEDLQLVDVPLDSWQVARFCMVERGA